MFFRFRVLIYRTFKSARRSKERQVTQMDPFAELYEKYQPDIYRFLLRMLGGDALAAEELTQETFYQAFLSFGRFRGDCTVKTWLCQIAHNVQIGDNTVMAAQCGIAGSTIIGKNCIFGGQVGIAGHIKIADHTTLGAQAGVIGNIRKSGEVLIGSPVIPVRQYMKAYAKFKQAAEE